MSFGVLGCLLIATAAASVGATPAQPVDDVTQRILELEDLGRGKPDEAARALEQLRDRTAAFSAQRLELLTVQGQMLASASHPEAAEQVALQLDAWSQTPGDANASTAAAAAALIRSSSMAIKDKLERAETLLSNAIARLPASVAMRDRCRLVSALAYINFDEGKLENAARLFHEELAMADQLGIAWRQVHARSTLSYVYYQAKQVDRARVLLNEALLLAEKAQDWVGLGRAYNAASAVLREPGDPQVERLAFQRAIMYARRAGAKSDEVGFLANQADFLLRNGEYKTALDSAEHALVLARELHDVASETVALANIGLAHISLQHIELGKRYARESMAIDERRGSLNSVSDAQRDLGEYLEKAGDLRGAITAYHEHRRMATTLLRDDQQKAILAMQEQYDAGRRNSALVLLGRENDLKAEQLHRSDLQQRLWWLFAALFALSFAVITLLYRRVRQTNALLSTSNELLKVQGERDPLTGLANRRHFHTAMRRFAAHGGLAGTVYLIDIDHFKQVNDHHGHSVGDLVLVEVGRRLRETLREPDLIVRWGGEEFLSFVPSDGEGQLTPDQLDALAVRMLVALESAPIAAGAQRIEVTASIGFASFPIGPGPLHVSWERAIGLVDSAMYLAKARGRNRACGVRLLQACDEAGLDAITRALEAAAHDGRVALTQLQRHTALEIAA